MNDFITISRNSWAKLYSNIELPLYIHLEKIISKNSLKISLDEIKEVYIPLIQFLHLNMEKKNGINSNKDNKKGTPFIIGVTGSVAAGKSTTAKVLNLLFQELYPNIITQSLSTDGFIYPNSELKRRNLMSRKGFPESYNTKLLHDFLVKVTKGESEITYPIYSQKLSDIVPHKFSSIKNPDILIIEGINILTFDELIDFSLYIDASENSLKNWYLSRFKMLLRLNKNNPNNYFYYWSHLPLKEAVNYAKNVWNTVNLVNLHKNIAVNKNKANTILFKKKNHKVSNVYIRTQILSR